MHALAGRGPEPVGQAHEKYKVESRGIEPLSPCSQHSIFPLDDDPMKKDSREDRWSGRGSNSNFRHAKTVSSRLDDRPKVNRRMKKAARG